MRCEARYWIVAGTCPRVLYWRLRREGRADLDADAAEIARLIGAPPLSLPAYRDTRSSTESLSSRYKEEAAQRRAKEEQG